MMEQLVLMTTGPEVDAAQLPFSGTLAGTCAADVAASTLNLGEMERRLLTEALQRTHGNVTRAAELLGLTRDALRYRMDKYGIDAAH